MFITLDHEGITYTRADDSFVTFYWSCLLLYFFSSRSDRGFFTVLHWVLFKVGLLGRKTKKVSLAQQGYVTSGSVSIFDPVAWIINQELTLGNDNFVIAAMCENSIAFLEMLADYRELSAFDTMGEYFVLRTTQTISLETLVDTLRRLHIPIHDIVKEGVAWSDH